MEEGSEQNQLCKIGFDNTGRVQYFVKSPGDCISPKKFALNYLDGTSSKSVEIMLEDGSLASRSLGRLERNVNDTEPRFIPADPLPSWISRVECRKYYNSTEISVYQKTFLRLFWTIITGK
jgi:hypothetical protein